VRFQEIVEELHVELVVFHDQDGFRHAGPALFPKVLVRPIRTASPRRALSGMIT
jgi:hypothetical protein